MSVFIVQVQAVSPYHERCVAVGHSARYAGGSNKIQRETKGGLGLAKLGKKRKVDGTVNDQAPVYNIFWWAGVWTR